MATNDENQRRLDSHASDRYEAQRKRNDKARQAAKDAGASKAWWRKATSDSLGRPSEESSVDGDEGWDSGNPEEPLGWD